MKSLIWSIFVFCFFTVFGCDKKTDVTVKSNAVEALCKSTGIYYATFTMNEFTSVSLFAKGKRGEIKFLELNSKKGEASIDGKSFNKFEKSNKSYKILVTVRGVDKPTISDADELWITLSVNGTMTQSLFSNPFKSALCAYNEDPKLINDRFAHLIFATFGSSSSYSTSYEPNALIDHDYDYVLTLKF